MRKQKLSANITIGGVLEKSFKKNIGLIRSGFETVGDSIKSVKARQKELTRQRRDLVKQGKSVEALDREYEDLERTLEQLVKKQRRWERAMRDSRRVGESFGKMSANIGRLSRRMALGVTAAGAGIFTLASSTASYGDQVAKTAGKLGIGIEALQEYRYAAERSGVSVETFDSSLTAMQKRLGEAAQGTGAAKKALEKLGLSAKDLVKLGPEEALAAISDKMRDIESPAERAALAAALFSRSGIGMVNMLGDGSKALQQLREDARRTGYVLSEEAARDAEAFADAQLDAQLVIKGLKNTIGRELMPVVTRSMKQFSAWAVANREDVAAFAETAATKIEAALPVIGKIIEGMATVSKEVGGVIAVVAKMVGGWENFGMIIGGVFAAKTIGSIVAFGASVARLGVSLIGLTGALPVVAVGIKAIGAVLLANPIGLAVAAIAGGAVLIYKNWETIGPWFGKLWDGVKETFGGIGQFISGVWRGDWDSAAEGAKTAWGGISSFYSTVWDAVGSVFKNTWENVIKPVTDALGATDTITAAWEGVKTSLKAVLDWMGQKFDWLMGKLQPVLDGLTWLRDKGTGAVDGIKGIGSSVSNFFGGGDTAPETPASRANPRSGRANPRHISGSFLGGEIGRGFRRVGENGPETIWNSKGAYVAHAGATERLSQMAEQARPIMAALGGGLRKALGPTEVALAPVLEQVQGSPIRGGREGAVDGTKGLGVSISDYFSDDDKPEGRPDGAKLRIGRANPRGISGSFLGGDIGRGFRRVGENGPETIWNLKGAYVAHAGATEPLSQMAERVRPMMAALGGGLRNAMGRAEVAAAPVLEQVEGFRMGSGQEGATQPAPASEPSQVVQHIKIVAAHLSVAQIADEIERRGRAARTGALYDAPHGYGQYEGA